MRRRSLVVTAAAVSLAVAGAGGAPAASTTLDPSGRILLDGTPVFPIVLSRGPGPGSRTPWGTDGLDEVARAGVTFLKTGPVSGIWTSAEIARATAWNRAAEARGVGTWVALGDLAAARPGTRASTLLTRVVETLTLGPGGSAIGMWKGADEPLLNLVHPPALRYPYCRVTSRGVPAWCAGETALDPSHLWITVQAPRGRRAGFAPYAAVTDVQGVNVYPVRPGRVEPDLHQVGRWAHTVAAASAGAPVWVTLQICAIAVNDPAAAHLLPTGRQERYMAYDAILNGARAVAFYGGQLEGCWGARDREGRWNWTFWHDVLRGLVSELSATSGVSRALVGEDWPTPVVADDRTTQVLARQGGAPGELWVIAARRGAGTARVTLAGLPAWARTALVSTEGRRVRVRAGALTDTFGRWGVHVYRITRAG